MTPNKIMIYWLSMALPLFLYGQRHSFLAIKPSAKYL